jgi:hypothetical protein
MKYSSVKGMDDYCPGTQRRAALESAARKNLNSTGFGNTHSHTCGYRGSKEG